MLIVGEDDAPCVKVHRFMADCLRRSTHIVLRGRGHLTNLEAPAAFNAAIRRFLAS
jgi:pimeloyl-ACP methyl ester carboxylesterase